MYLATKFVFKMFGSSSDNVPPTICLTCPLWRSIHGRNLLLPSIPEYRDKITFGRDSIEDQAGGWRHMHIIGITCCRFDDTGPGIRYIKTVRYGYMCAISKMQEIGSSDVVRMHQEENKTRLRIRNCVRKRGGRKTTMRGGKHQAENLNSDVSDPP